MVTQDVQAAKHGLYTSELKAENYNIVRKRRTVQFSTTLMFKQPTLEAVGTPANLEYAARPRLRITDTREQGKVSRETRPRPY